MMQIAVLSGKGGTGKTSIGAALAHLSSLENHFRSVFVDADVDAANLSLVLQPETSCVHQFWGGALAVVRSDSCSNCGACTLSCRYDAIFPDPGGKPSHWVDPMACDGCAACVYACPQGAICMRQQQEGNWLQSDTLYGALFHAELFPGRENSGKLVTLIRQQARLYAQTICAELVIVDGPPGIGCPVISACAGVDLGLIVTEPGLAGIHDLKRISGTLQHFRVPAVICINKADIYPEGKQAIHEFAVAEGIEVIGEIPYDEAIPRSMVDGRPVTLNFPGSPAALSIQAVWRRVVQRLLLQEN